MRQARLLAAIMAAALVLLSLPGGALADPVVTLPKASLSISASGTLEYVTDLETPHYEVGGWAVTAPAQSLLARLVGRPVSVTGKPGGSISILMKPELAITAMKATLEGELIETADAYELDGWILKGLGKVQILAGSTVRITGTVLWDSASAPQPALEVTDLTPLTVPTPQPIVRKVDGTLEQGEDQVYSVQGWALQGTNARGLQKLSGQDVSVIGNVVTGSDRPTLKVTQLQATVIGPLIEVTDLETPHFEVNGFVIAADMATLSSLASLTVAVRGNLSPDLTIYMKPMLEAVEMKSISDPLPDLVVVAGVAPVFPTDITMQDTHLMLPLRAVVETAGGSVAWDPVARAVRVTVGEVSSIVRIGSDNYGDVQLTVAPFIQDGYTMVPLDLLAHLGLDPHYQDNILYLAESNFSVQ